MLIAPKLGEVLVFAGLLGRFTDEATGDMLPAVTILTTWPIRIYDASPSREGGPSAAINFGSGDWASPAYSQWIGDE